MTDAPQVTEAPAGTNPHRRSPLFWLLLITTGVFAAIAIASIVYPFLRRVATIRRFESQNVGFTVEPHGPDWVRNWFGRDRRVGAPSIGPFDRVTRIDWRSKRDLPAGFFVMLEQFPNVRELHVNYTSITDDDLPAIARLPSLQTLDLAHNRLHGRGFHCLKTLPHLKSVNLTYCPIRDVAIDVLEQIPTLEALSIYACRHLTCGRVRSFLSSRSDVRVVGLKSGSIDLLDCDRQRDYAK